MEIGVVDKYKSLKEENNKKNIKGKKHSVGIGLLCYELPAGLR